LSRSDVFHSIAVTGGVARARVHRTHAERLCAGHFPGDPVVPGSSLAGLMAEVASCLVAERGERMGLVEVVRCVFLHPVRPDDAITVSARVRDGTCVDAQVDAGGRRTAGATFRFGIRA
jgi:3-hydroxymyristoyl/3-hydroxydecanoyl-(acyl carrier protein) dehydratase